MRRSGKSCVLFCSLLLSGCTRLVANQTAPVLQESIRAFERESDIQLAREALPAQLKTLDGLLEVSPKNRLLLEIGARAYIQYAFGFLEDELEALPPGSLDATSLAERATAFYERALDYALRHLDSFDDRFSAAMAGDLAAVERELTRMNPARVPGLLNAAMALALIANLNPGDLQRVASLPKVVAIMERVRTLAPRTHYGTAPMVLALIHIAFGKSSVSPEKASEEFARARAYFDEAIAAGGVGYLMNRVMMARHYAAAIRNCALYRGLLVAILESTDSPRYEQRLANMLARRRAHRYLDQVKTLLPACPPL